MKYKDVETEADLIEYCEDLLDFLCNHVSCLDELITIFEEEDE